MQQSEFRRKGQHGEGAPTMLSCVVQMCHVVTLKAKILTGLKSLTLIFLLNISGFETKQNLVSEYFYLENHQKHGCLAYNL